MRLNKFVNEERFKPAFYYHILNNYNVAKSTLKKVNKYTENWKQVVFDSQELKWMKDIPETVKPPSKIYRGMFVKTGSYFPRGKTIIYKPIGQFSSWTGDKNNVDYFQRGNGFPITLEAELPNNYFYIANLFNLIDDITEFIDRNKDMYAVNKNEERIEDLLDMPIYNEDEIWIFGKIKARVIDGE